MGSLITPRNEEITLDLIVNEASLFSLSII